MTTDSSLRVQAQDDYYNWHMVGDLAGQLKQDPSASERVAEALIKLSHTHQAHIVSFAQGKLGYTPYVETPWNPRPTPRKLGFWRRVISAFQPK